MVIHLLLFLCDILIHGLILSIVVYMWFSYCYGYWKNRNFPYLKPNFPLGNNQSFLCKFPGPHMESYDYYTEIKKRGLKFAGVFSIIRPVLVVVDPQITKDVFVKDFQYFTDRGFYKHPSDHLSMNLFGLDAAEWRLNRIELTSTFTSGKIRMMIPSIVSVSDSMLKKIEESVIFNADINIKEISSEFTINSIASCTLGVTSGSSETLDNYFGKMTKKYFETESFSHLLRVSFINRFPDLSSKLGLRFIKKEVEEFFFGLVDDCMEYRKKNKFRRSDFLQMLIDLKNRKNEEIIFTDEFVAAQVFSFFAAALETSSIAIAFTLYELGNNQHIQEKLRSEIMEILKKHDDQLNDVSLNEMKYLRQVIYESVRLYPPVTSLERKCTKNYTIEDTDLIIEKGVSITIPIYGIHRDPQNYPDPEKFDPERFNAYNKANIKPYTYIPFGVGPRNCLGLRFAHLMIQVALIQILRRFRINVSPSTRLPFEMDKHDLFLSPKNPIFLRVEKL